MPSRGGFAAACLLAAAVSGRAQGQAIAADASRGDDVRVSGQVVDRSTGREVPAARVVLTPTWSGGDSAAAPRETQSDSAGHFRIDGLPPGGYDLRVEALGYTDVSTTVGLSERGHVELRVEMSPAALDLEPLVVTAVRPAWLAEAGFYERRSLGMGYTLTRSEIEARNPHRVSDLFYGIPGADVIGERTGYSPAHVLLRGRCVPQVVLDGAPFSGPVPIDQVLSVGELEAVEVYHGSSSPVRYSTSSCGTILLWSRRGTAEGRPLTWTRFLTALGIVGWFAWALVME